MYKYVVVCLPPDTQTHTHRRLPPPPQPTHLFTTHNNRHHCRCSVTPHVGQQQQQQLGRRRQQLLVQLVRGQPLHHGLSVVLLETAGPRARRPRPRCLHPDTPTWHRRARKRRCLAKRHRARPRHLASWHKLCLCLDDAQHGRLGILATVDDVSGGATVRQGERAMAWRLPSCSATTIHLVLRYRVAKEARSRAPNPWERASPFSQNGCLSPWRGPAHVPRG